MHIAADAFIHDHDAQTAARCESLLEHGGLVVLPELAFRLEPGEERFLDVRKRLDPRGVFLNDHLRELFGL